MTESANDRVWKVLCDNVEDHGLTVQQIATAANVSINDVQVVIDDSSDIAWGMNAAGEDTYLWVAHLDPEGWTEW